MGRRPKCAVCGKRVDLKRQSWVREIKGPFVNHPTRDPEPYLVPGPVSHQACVEKTDA